MAFLLDQGEENIPIAKMLERIACRGRYSRGVLQFLLERNLVNIDESVMETLASNFWALGALLSWRPGTPITEKVLMF
ncbi:hypothetical protein N7456_013230 [Penicillium angulare]|uniref:Uncharacterized protein n=1 Tax=Penicillium angulare TaxID=116970 RepID=A0A9W9JW67_9EURO|nr:hypothetical protein N7456_013230 [Penicillium angulare]